MAAQRTPGSSMRRTLSLVSIVVGALLLLIMPSILFYYAVTGNNDVELPGTLVILTTTGGMTLVILGFVLRE